MSIRYLCFLVMLSGLLSPVIAQSDLDHLRSVNPYWSEKRFAVFAEEPVLPAHDITWHLTWVEKYLRRYPAITLSETQRANRLHCLDLLRAYIDAAQFPRNLYHNERVPCFIDDFGNVCAVGHLMIQTGWQDVAGTIRAECNFGEFMALADEFPALEKWSEEHGFSKDELAWIQPFYCHGPCCDLNGEIRHVSCYGGCDGCFFPETPDSIAWKIVTTSLLGTRRLNENGEITREFYLPCGLHAGFYEVDMGYGLIDTDYVVITYSFEILQPDWLRVDPIISHDQGSCDARIQLNIEGGVRPYFVSWITGDTGTIVTGLCGGYYQASIEDANACEYFYEFHVEGGSTSVQSAGDPQMVAYPTIVSAELNIDLPGSTNAELTLFTIDGTSVYMLGVIQGLTVLDLSHYPPGVYMLSGHVNGQGVCRKIIKT